MIPDIAIASSLSEKEKRNSYSERDKRLLNRGHIKCITPPLDVTDAEQFPNIAEAVAHAKNLRGV